MSQTIYSERIYFPPVRGEAIVEAVKASVPNQALQIIGMQMSGVILTSIRTVCFDDPHRDLVFFAIKTQGEAELETDRIFHDEEYRGLRIDSVHPLMGRVEDEALACEYAKGVGIDILKRIPLSA